MNPTTVTEFVTGAANQISLTTAIPLNPPKIDIMVLVDTSSTVSLAALLNLQALLALNFGNNAATLGASVYIGLSTFQNPTTCLLSLSVGVKLSLTASISDFVTAAGLYLTASLQVGCSTSGSGAQLGAMVSTAATSGGWRSDAFKVMVVITDTTFGEGNPAFTFY